MCSTPSSSFPSSDQYLVNLVAFLPFQLFRADLAEGTETTGRCHGGINRTHNTLTGCCSALTSASPRLCPLCVRPRRSPWGSCSNCTSAEVETDCTPVCFVFVFHSSFAVNTACAPFEALIRDWFSAPYGRFEQAKVLKQRSLWYAFVRDRRVLCLFIYKHYTCAAPGECVASDNELITWFIYGLLPESPPNTIWFSCSVEQGAVFRSSRL